MKTSSLQISLLTPQVHQINLNEPLMQAIGLTTPVPYGTAKLSIDTLAHWEERPTYIPKKGEIIVYSNRRTVGGVDYPGIKIGDGNAYVVDLPFVGDDTVDLILDLLYDHINDMDVHIYPEERTGWNAKVSCDIDGERLILERTDSNA